MNRTNAIQNVQLKVIPLKNKLEKIKNKEKKNTKNRKIILSRETTNRT